MVIVKQRGLLIPIKVDTELLQTGWYGGLWVTVTGNRIVSKANKNNRTGFLLWGHKLKDLEAKRYKYNEGHIEVPWQYENVAVRAFGQAVMVCDSGEFDFNSNVYDSTLIYNYMDKLYVNDNGILTNVNNGSEDVGVVIGTPQDNNGWLGVILAIGY